MLAIAHGYQIRTEGEDPLVTLVTQVADQFGEAAMPGTFLVDVFPFRECCVPSSMKPDPLTKLSSALFPLMASGRRMEKEGRCIQGRSCVIAGSTDADCQRTNGSFCVPFVSDVWLTIIGERHGERLFLRPQFPGSTCHREREL